MNFMEIRVNFVMLEKVIYMLCVNTLDSFVFFLWKVFIKSLVNLSMNIGKLELGRVISKKCGQDNNLVGYAGVDPVLYKILYVV